MQNSFNPNPENSPSLKKIYKAGVIDVSKLAEAQARDVADSRMTEDKEDRSKNWFTRTAKRIWKHNLAQEWYRQREIGRVKTEISESGNLYAGENKDTTVKDFEEAKKAIIERFTSEYEDDMLKKEEKDSKKTVTDESTKTALKDLIRQFAGDNSFSEEAFKEEQKRILSKSNPDYSKKGKMYADNFLEIAREIRNSVAHGEKLNELDFDVEVTLGEARESLNTEAKHNTFEKIIEKTQNSKLGKYLFNEPAGVAIAAGLYSAANFFGVKMLRSKLAKWGTFGATALFAGGISTAKEASRLNRERAQHIRESAKGVEFKEEDMKRRKQMEENRYETKSASEIIDNFEQDLAKVSDGSVKESELDAILANLSEVEARIKLGEDKKIDLISYTRFNTVEKEKMIINNYKAKLKVLINRGINEGRIEFTKGGFDSHLQSLINVQSSERVTSDIEKKDKIFKKMKRKKVAWAFGKTALIGGTVGFIFQEAQAAFTDRDGFFEGVFKSDEHLSSKATSLEGLRRWVTGDGPRVPFGTGHEMLVGNTHMQLPDGVTMIKNPDNTYNILCGNEVISHNFKPEFITSGNNVGDLTEESKAFLAKDNIISDFSKTGGTVTEHITRTSEEYINKHPELTKKVHFSWMANDTPMHGRDPITGKWILEADPITGKMGSGADLNELRTQWGGINGTGIDANGDYVLNVQHMTDDGSFQDGLSVAAREQMKKGGLDIFLSVTKGIQHMTIPLHINELGQAIAKHDSDVGKMLFENVKGQAVFNGAYASIAYSNGLAPDGGTNLQVLGTLEGTGHPKDIVEDVIKDTTVSNIKFGVPAAWDYEVPPVIPIPYRRPLERGEYIKEEPLFTYYMNYNGITTEEELVSFEKTRSITLKENPNAKLDHYKEIKMYLEKMNPNYFERIKRLSEQTKKMEKECKVSINIPIAGHQESQNIYEALKNYATQTAKPETFELVLFVNHPETDGKGNKLKATDTLNEIEKFKKDYPNIRSRVIYEILSDKEANIGRIRKLMSDATLLRHHQRGKDAPDLIMISNDADNKGIDPRYIDAFIEKFEKNEKVDGFLGQLDWDPESYQKFPDVHIGTRLFQYLNLIGRYHTHGMTSSGANSAYRSSIYAGIGGYLENVQGGEDVNIRKAIIAARGDNRSFDFAGTETRLFTSSRRAIVMLKQFGLVPLDQWRRGFSVQGDEEIRKLTMDDNGKINYEDKGTLEKLKIDLEYVINQSLNIYEEGERLGKDNPYYKKAISWLGIKYQLDNKGNMIITDMTSLVEGLKKYQEEGKLIRDERSGNVEAGEKLRFIREARKKTFEEEIDKIKNLKESVENKKSNSEELEKAVENFIDQLPDNNQKIDELNKILGKSLNNDVLLKLGLNTSINEIKRKFEQCKKIESGADFIKEVRKILSPISIAMDNHPEEFVGFKRKVFNETHNFIPVNEVFSYKVDEGDLHIHMAPSSDLNAISKVRLIKDALEKLPEIIKSNKKIKKISATSWIVASNPGLLEKIGFKIEGPISEKTRKTDFEGETMPISRATISRKEFLKKYLKEKDGFIKKLMNLWKFNPKK